MDESDDESAAERDAQVLEQGQVVFHPMLGFGVVEADERGGRVSVAMSSGEHLEFVTRIAKLVRLSSTPLPDVRADDTFEPLPDEPAQCIAFDAFDLPPERLSALLVDAARHALSLTTFGAHFVAPYAAPPKVGEGVWQLAWLDPNVGLGFVALLCMDAGAVSIDRVLPYPQPRLERVVLRRVRVDGQLPDAVIEASWGGNLIALADTAYLDNAGWYSAGQSYWFQISAVAIECGPATTEIWEVPVPAWLPSADTADVTPPLTLEPASTETMVALLCEPTLGPAMHWFRGRVVSVERSPMFNRPGWLIEIVVLYDHTQTQRRRETPLVLNLLLPEAAWRGATEPAAGEYLQGVLWLQGRMHCPGGLPGGRMPQPREKPWP